MFSTKHNRLWITSTNNKMHKKKKQATEKIKPNKIKWINELNSHVISGCTLPFWSYVKLWQQNYFHWKRYWADVVLVAIFFILWLVVHWALVSFILFVYVCVCVYALYLCKRLRVNLYAHTFSIIQWRE